MARVKRGVVAGRRHKKILKKAKGYFNARRKVFRTAKQAVIKAGQYAYRGRREKKREFRALWITRINAAARLCGADLQHADRRPEQGGLAIDRKVLADLAVHDMPAFTALIAEKAKASLTGLTTIDSASGSACGMTAADPKTRCMESSMAA
jgi:large subunit ribosomal protein L20